jgi:hypothetical protein
LGRRQDRAGGLVEAEKLDDVADVLREDVVVAPGQDRDGACAQATQLGEAGGVFQDVYRFELDLTDRQKLFEFQTARSSRLPEYLQSCCAHGGPLLHRVG